MSEAKQANVPNSFTPLEIEAACEMFSLVLTDANTSLRLRHMLKGSAGDVYAKFLRMRAKTRGGQ